MGHRTSATTPDGGTWSCSYNADGQVLTETDPLGHRTSFAYDFATRKVSSITDAMSHTTSYGLDNLGRRRSMVDALGRITTYEYDALGRLKRTIHPDSSTVELQYD